MPAFRGVHHSICTDAGGMAGLRGGCWPGVQRQSGDQEQGPVFPDFEEIFNVEACFMSIKHIKHCYCYWDCISP